MALLALTALLAFLFDMADQSVINNQIDLWYHSVKCTLSPLTSWGKNSVDVSGIHWF